MEVARSSPLSLVCPSFASGVVLAAVSSFSSHTHYLYFFAWHLRCRVSRAIHSTRYMRFSFTPQFISRHLTVRSVGRNHDPRNSSTTLSKTKPTRTRNVHHNSSFLAFRVRRGGAFLSPAFLRFSCFFFFSFSFFLFSGFQSEQYKKRRKARKAGEKKSAALLVSLNFALALDRRQESTNKHRTLAARAEAYLVPAFSGVAK